jgi:hypothetical protein
MHARPGKVGLLAIAASSTLIAAAATEAHHAPGDYSGTVVGGGTVKLEVSANSRTITRLEADLGMTACGYSPLFRFNNVGVTPIVNHAFSYKDVTWGTVSGSFTAAGTARGSVQYRRETDPACTVPARTWSATPAVPVPSPVPTASPVPTVAPLPTVTLTGKRTQRVGRTLAVSVAANEAGSARATGRATVRRSRGISTRYTLRAATTQLVPNVAARVRLRVPNRARAAIAKALRSGKRASAVVTVTVTNAAGISARARRSIRLRR